MKSRADRLLQGSYDGLFESSPPTVAWLLSSRKDGTITAKYVHHGSAACIDVFPNFFELPGGDAIKLHVLAHEIGHAWWNQHGHEYDELSAHNEWWEHILDYRCASEALAEAFAVYVTEPGHLKQHHPWHYERVKELVGNASWVKALAKTGLKIIKRAQKEQTLDCVLRS